MSIAEESSERIMSIIKKISGRIPNFLRLRLPRKTSLLRKPPRIMVARRQSHTETPNIITKTHRRRAAIPPSVVQTMLHPQ